MRLQPALGRVLGLSLLLSGAGNAQQPAIVVLLRDPSGAPVQAANGWLRSEPTFALAALPATLPPALRGVVPDGLELSAIGDERGVLRFVAGPGQRLGTGSGMVTTPAGLGSLLPRLYPGRATRTTLQPMALVTTTSGSESFRLWARSTLRDGSQVTLPEMAGRELRLPVGDYEIWAHSRDGWLWQRLRLATGDRAELNFSGDAQRLLLPASAFVHPNARADIDLLLGVVGDHEVLLRGAALAAPLVTWLGEQSTPARVVPGPPTGTARPWPPMTDRVDDRERYSLPDASADAALFGLVRGDDGSFRCVGASRSNAEGLLLPPRPHGDTWLLLLATGHAPMARPWSTTAAGSTLLLEPGRELVVEAKDQGARPVVDLAIEYEPEGQPAARVVAHTDAFGQATFGRVHGPGRLLVSDTRFANQQVELDELPAGALPIEVAIGGECRGKVEFADGQQAETIVVTLRDTFGWLRPAERTVVVATGETFSFAGLPDDRDLVLFATAQRGGTTWSGRAFVRAGHDAIDLKLQNEDPVLRAPDKR